MSDNRNSVYFENGKYIYRISAFGSCDKALLAARIGMQPAPPPKVLAKAYQEGHDAEEEILMMTADQTGWDIHAHQREVQFVTGPRTLARGHIDGLAEEDDHLVVIDAKNLSDKAFNDWMRNGVENFRIGYKYGIQAYGYMLGLDAEAFAWAIRNKETDEVVVQKFWKNEIEDLFDLNPTYFITRTSHIEKMAKDGQDVLLLNCEEEFGCAFYYLHDNQTGHMWWEDGASFSVQEEEVLVALARGKKNADEAFKLAKQAKEEQDRLLYARVARVAPALPDELTEEDRDTVKWSADLGTAKITRFLTNSSSLDYGKLEEDGIDINEYKVKKYREQIRVTLREDKQ